MLLTPFWSLIYLMAAILLQFSKYNFYQTEKEPLSELTLQVQPSP